MIESQHFILGPEVEALEREVAAYSGCADGVGMSSGTDALLATLMAIELKPGDEVVTSTYSFFATAGAVARLGGKPVFTDVDPRTLNMDASRLADLATDRTRAIIPVHLFGQACEMEPVLDMAARHRLTVIEDAAQAIGTEWRGRRAGSIGHIGCFSFFPSKNLGGFGDGGMGTTSDRALADQLRLYRNHGYRPKYYSKVVGGNFRLDAIQAAVLRVKLPHLDSWTAGRQRNAAAYRRLFAERGVVTDGPAAVAGGVVLPYEADGGRHIYNQFVIRATRRDELLGHLKARGIGREVYYPVPLHLQECFRDLGHRPGDFPHAEAAAAESLALPIYPELLPVQLEAVVHAVAQFVRS